MFHQKKLIRKKLKSIVRIALNVLYNKKEKIVSCVCFKK